MARLKKIGVAQELFQQMMTEGWQAHIRCIKGLPEGAELVGTFFQGGRVGGIAYLVYYHESFEDLPVGAEMPEVTPTFRRVEIDRGQATGAD